MYPYLSARPSRWATLFSLICLALIHCTEKPAEPLPDQYQSSGAFIRSLPYFNPDSCVLLVRRDVAPCWQGAAYENMFLDGPEDSPLELGFKHLDYYEKNFPADTARAFAQLWRGRLLTHLGKLDSARMCLQESYDLSMRDRHYLRASDAQQGLAGIHSSQGNSLQAIRSYLAVYDAVKNLDSTQLLRKQAAMGNLSRAYAQSGNPREAMAWTQREWPLVADESQPALRPLKVGVYMEYANIYRNLELPDSAIFRLQQALALHEKYQTINNKSELLHMLGNAYLQKGDYATALRYSQEAFRAVRGNNPSQYSKLESGLAEIYFYLGRLDSAEILYQRAIVIESPTSSTAIFTRNRLSDIYAQRGNFKAAYDALLTAKKMREKVYNIEKIQEVGAAKAELELELAQHHFTERETAHQLDRQRNLIAVLLLLLLLGFALTLFYRQRSRRRILEQENQLLEQDKEILAQAKQLAEANEQLRIQELKHSQATLQSTQAELDTTARLLTLKTQLIEDLELRLHQEHLAPIQASPPGSAGDHKLPHMRILTEKDWVRFREWFDQQMPGFFQHLRNQYMELTAAEIRLFLLIKLKFDTLEISEALGISKESVWRSRHRLSKKLGLVETGNLDGFVVQFV